MANQFQAVPLSNPIPEEHRRQLAIVVNNSLDGKLNSTGSVTLTASQTTTTLSDRRLGGDSVIVFMPTTANASAGITSLYVSAQGKQTATLTHANNGQTDRTYKYIIIG
jgi:hypothetical protein|tara:strand:- start:9453 stop:9779 length:327 start_codon:yes stop_codon:yes gene_type:complete